MNLKKHYWFINWTKEGNIEIYAKVLLAVIDCLEKIIEEEL